MASRRLPWAELPDHITCLGISLGEINMDLQRRDSPAAGPCRPGHLPGQPDTCTHQSSGVISRTATDSRWLLLVCGSQAESPGVRGPLLLSPGRLQDIVLSQGSSRTLLFPQQCLCSAQSAVSWALGNQLS